MTHLHRVRLAVVIIAVIDLGEEVLAQLGNNEGIVMRSNEHFFVFVLFRHILINNFTICFLIGNIYILSFYLSIMTVHCITRGMIPSWSVS